MTSATEERPVGAPPAPEGSEDGRAPITVQERLRRVGELLVILAVGLPIGVVVHRLSGELEVDRRFWTTLAIGAIGTIVLTFCFPRWRRFPSRPSRPGSGPRTPIQKALTVVLLGVLLVAAVTITYYRLAD